MINYFMFSKHKMSSEDVQKIMFPIPKDLVELLISKYAQIFEMECGSCDRCAPELRRCTICKKKYLQCKSGYGNKSIDCDGCGNWICKYCAKGPETDNPNYYLVGCVSDCGCVSDLYCSNCIPKDKSYLRCKVCKALFDPCVYHYQFGFTKCLNGHKQ